MPVNTVSLDQGTVLSQGLSITTAGNSAVSAYGPRIGRNVAVVALTIAAFDSTRTTAALSGATAGDPVFIGAPSAVSADLLWQGFVSAADEVTLQFTNSTLTAIVQTAQTWNVEVARRSFITRI